MFLTLTLLSLMLDRHLFAESENYHHKLPMTTPPRMCSSIMARGRGP